MAKQFDPSQNYTGNGSTTGSGSNSTLPGTTDSTATTGSTTQPSSLSAQQIAQFESAYHVTASELPAYINGNQLTALGQALEWYGSLSGSDLQNAQETLVALNFLKSTDATGQDSTTTLDAFKQMLSQGHLNDYQTALSDPTTLARAQANSELASAEKTIGNATPVPATLENPTTLRATLNNAFAQTLGYAPSEQQLNSFVSAMQGQDVAYAEAGVQQNKATAQGEASSAKNELTALNNLGSDGVDTFLSAYTSAIHGLGGGTTTQGNVTGSPTAPGSAAEGPFLPGQNPNGPVSMEVNTLSGPQPQYFNLHGQAYQEPTHNANGTITPAPTSELAHTLGSSHGGLFSLSPGVWQQAVAALGDKNPVWGGKPPPTTAGAASATEQQAAVRTLALSLYQQTSSWQDVAITLAGGNPSKPTQGHVLNSSENYQTFAQGIASSVNNQLQTIENQANQLPQVTEHVTAPDAAAEANAAAKEADPVGYTAANFASWGSLLGKMIYGRPQDQIQSTADTFTGPAPTSALGTAA